MTATPEVSQARASPGDDAVRRALVVAGEPTGASARAEQRQPDRQRIVAAHRAVADDRVESLAQVTSRPDVVFRPVRDAGPYVVSVALRAGSRDRRVAASVRVAVDAPTEPVVGAAG